MNAFLGVRVEILLLLIVESLSLKSVCLLLLELLHSDPVLDVGLTLLEVLQFGCTLTLFFLLLFLGHLQLFVTDPPELGEVFLFLPFSLPLCSLALNLQLATSLNGGLHLCLALLLLFIESVGTILSLGYLSVQNFLLVVLEGTKLFNLAIDHILPSLLLILESLVLALFLHVFETFALLSESFNLLFLFNFLTALSFFHLHELRIGLGQVSTHLGDLLLAHNFTLLFALQIFLDLSLDEFTLKHLFLELLNEVEFKVLELLADVFRVCLLQLVLLLELSAHLFIVLAHLLALDFFPMLVNITFDLLLALNHALLGLLLIGNIAHEHFTLEGLNHILLLVHVLVGTLNLLATKLVLVFLLLGVLSSALNLSHNNNDSN